MLPAIMSKRFPETDFRYDFGKGTPEVGAGPQFAVNVPQIIEVLAQ